MARRGKEWYRRFFEGIALDVWDAACGPDLTASECDLLEKVLELQPGMSLLDAPCGLGRHAIELVSRGYRVTGVDISSEALERTRGRAALRGVSVETWQGNLTDLPWNSAFSGAYCLGNSFGYFERMQTQAFIERIGAALLPGGRFLLETGLAAESILPNLDERNWVEVGDFLMLIENDYQVKTSCLKTTFTFIRGRQREVRTAWHYVFSVAEISSFLTRAALKPVEFFSSHELEPFTVGDHNLFVLAEKS